MTGVLNRTGTGDLISCYGYGYETSGYEKTSRRTFRDSQVGTGAAQHINYGYDVVGQMQSEVSVETPTPSLNQSFTYDAMGNRQTSQGGSGASLSNSVSTRNPLNQITQTVTTPTTGAATTTALVYDVSGNLTQARGLQSPTAGNPNGTPTGTASYSYTDQDALESYVSYTAAGVPSHKTAYTYDGLGRKRITREADWNTTTGAWNTPTEKRYLLDGMDVVQERDDQNAVTTTYVRAGNIGGLLSKSKRVAGQNDTHLYYHYDGQGNVVQLTGATQATVATYSYDAFGNDRGTSGAEAAGNLYRFSTKEFQAYSGLYDYGLRFYSPSLGRFINRDPSGEVGGLNLYAAFANNPVSFVDEYGLNAASAIHGFAVGLGVSIPVAWGVAASTGIVCTAFSELAPVFAVIGGLLGAVALADMMSKVKEIEDSNLCPDEKDFQLGLLAGSFLGTIIGGKAGAGFKPKVGPVAPVNNRGNLANDTLHAPDGKPLVKIPPEAVRETFTEVPGGATEGVKYKWSDGNQTWRIRFHNADPGAPPGSNSGQGWVARVRRGTNYMDSEGVFHTPGSINSSEKVFNDTHIPINEPPAYPFRSR